MVRPASAPPLTDSEANKKLLLRQASADDTLRERQGGTCALKPLRLFGASEGRTVGEVREPQGDDAWRGRIFREANLAEEN